MRGYGYAIVGDKPQLNLAGASLIGAPYISIGFNEALGWTHTVNNVRPSDLFELELRNGTYRFSDSRLQILRMQSPLPRHASLNSISSPTFRQPSEVTISLKFVNANCSRRCG